LPDDHERAFRHFGGVTLTEDWTDRRKPPTHRPLTYKKLADLYKISLRLKTVET
jgi:hypothetical protein